MLGKGLREKPKLGPSHDFLTNVKLLEKLEKAESGGENGTASRQDGRTEPARHKNENIHRRPPARQGRHRRDSGGLAVSLNHVIIRGEYGRSDSCGRTQP